MALRTNLQAIVDRGLRAVRSILLPVALFGLVVLGLHTGSDQLDDLAFSLINTVDRFVDAVVIAALKRVIPLLGWGPEVTRRVCYVAASVVDLEDKRWAARVLALLFELVADLMIVWPVLRHRFDRTPVKAGVAYLRSPGNVGAVLAPAAVALAAMAGALVVAQQAQLQLFWFFRWVGRPWSGRLAGFGALMVLGLVLARVAWPAFRAGLAFGRAQAGRKPWRHGWYSVAPFLLACLAFAPAPLWRTLRGLRPW